MKFALTRRKRGDGLESCQCCNSFAKHQYFIVTKAIEAILRRRTASTEGKFEMAETRQDLLQHVIEQGKRPDNDQPLTSLEIIDHMSEVLIGGSETTSTQIGTLFLELARNPIVRAKLLASLPAVSIHDENVVSAKAVRLEKDQYEYLEACIKENLRLHPIASELGRRTGSEWMELGGYSLPPYTVVCASYRAVHRSEYFWPKPLRFWPERVSRTHRPCQRTLSRHQHFSTDGAMLPI